MTLLTIYAVMVVVTVLVFIYLLVAIIRPDLFS